MSFIKHLWIFWNHVMWLDKNGWGPSCMACQEHIYCIRAKEFDSKGVHLGGSIIDIEKTNPPTILGNAHMCKFLLSKCNNIFHTIFWTRWKLLNRNIVTFYLNIFTCFILYFFYFIFLFTYMHVFFLQFWWRWILNGVNQHVTKYLCNDGLKKHALEFLGVIFSWTLKSYY